MKYGVIILAAGKSVRMGTSKQLLQIDNETLIRKTIKAALAILPTNCLVVLGANYERHYQEIKDLPVDIIENRDWKKGIGSSIKSGIRHLENQYIDAVIILVCDQPLLTMSHLKNLTDQYEKTRAVIIASYYNSTAGVPVLFDQSVFPLLTKLPDSEGAKSILLKNELITVSFDGGAFDLDTLQDLKSFKRIRIKSL